VIIFYSGSCGITKGVKRPRVYSEPETILRERANVMLSYYLITTDGQDQHERFPLIAAARRKQRGRRT